MMEIVELAVTFVEEFPPLKGFSKEHLGTWDDGGCDRFRVAADPAPVEGAFEYHLAALGTAALAEGEALALGMLDQDWKAFKAGSLVLYRHDFLEWTSNSIWVFPR